MSRDMHVRLRYLVSDRDRHGNVRLYVRKNGRKVRIAEQPGTDEFLTAYRDAVARLTGNAQAVRVTPAPQGSFGWVARQYFASDEFKALDRRSQATRRSVIEQCLREPPNPTSSHRMAFYPARKITPKVVKMLLARKAGKPGAANNRRKYLSAMFRWAAEEGYMAGNPARDVKRIQSPSEGFYTWTVDDVRQYEVRHPVGTKARLALALLLFLGVRRGDLVGLGRQNMKDGGVAFVPAKTRYKRRDMTWKPILPTLAGVIAQSPCGDMTFLVSDYGRPFTAAGFGNKFRQWCNEAGLPKCSAHGLRKAGATILAENGATDRQLMAIYDWTTASQATVYTRAADRKRLAADAMPLLASGTKTGTD